MKKISIFLMMLCFACFGMANAQQTQNVLTEDFSGMSSIPTTYSATDWYAYNAGNGNNWVLSSGAARYNYSSSYAANCYLVSAPFSVSNDMIELSVSLVEKTGSYAETFEVFLVKASDVTSDAAIVSATQYTAIASASYNNTTAATVSGSVTDAALAGQSVRVVVHCTSAADMYYLTVDDITVNETIAPQGPYIMLTPTEETVFTGFTTTLTATYGNVTNPTINYISSNTSVATVIGNGTTATVTGESAGTATITAIMTVDGTDYTATCAITVEDPSYCTPNPSSVDGKGITALTFGAGDYVVNNSNSNGLPSSSPFYGDYTSMVGSCEPGETVTVTITYSTGSSTVYSYGTLIWVDWNKNYEFEDSEIVYTGTSAQGSGGTPQVLTATFNVPGNQAADDYRMRIAGADSYFDSYIGGNTSANHSPCFSSSYAVCHDYTLRVAAGNPCGMPSNLQASQVGTTTAHLSWDGTNDSYILQYRTAAHDNMNQWEQVGNDVIATATLTQYTFDLSNYSGTGNIAIRHYNISDMFRLVVDDIVVTDANGQEVVNEGFESGSIPSGWTNYDLDGDGNVWIVGNYDSGVQNGTYCVYSESYSNDTYSALTPDNWLIIPNVALGGTLTLYARGTDVSFPQENFGVFVTTASLETVFATTPAGNWSAEIPVSTTSYDLTGLTANTPYEWQVKGICNEYTDPSNWASSSFTTIPEGFKTFVTEGNWDVADNWFPAGVPTSDDEVSIEAPVTIPAGVIATAKRATINGGSILIKDGGQLKQGAATLRVTVEKEIAGYGDGDGNYYFISSPFSGRTLYQESGTWSRVDNMLTGDYDLYAFDATAEDGLEWINYKSSPTHISFQSDNGNAGLMYGEGYLYANQEGTTLKFVGTAGKSIDYSETREFDFDAESTDDWNGWTLVGNFFTCDAYITYSNAEEGSSEADFYVMNETGDGYNLSNTDVALAPCTGAFVNYKATGMVEYSTELPAKLNKTGMINMTLTQGRGNVDQARIRFGQGRGLEKMNFRNSSKLYMTQDNKDYAVVYAENESEMPVNFKAESNGTYTLSFNTQNVEFGYLHLIDNMTGDDVDLLSTPSYTFEARTTDYASRFRLVFAAGSANDNFAFYNNGSFVINNEGMATVQVIDINGRIISSESINGSANINVNAATGVYMLRLINGENVKVQKVIVK